MKGLQVLTLQIHYLHCGRGGSLLDSSPFITRSDHHVGHRDLHRCRLWEGQPGHVPQIIEKCPCIYLFLPPSAPQYLSLPIQYF